MSEPATLLEPIEPPVEAESGVHPIALEVDIESGTDADRRALVERACLIAGHFPWLPPGPKPSPGYTMPSRELQPDRHVHQDDLTGRVFGHLHVRECISRGHTGARYVCVCTRLGPDGQPCRRTRTVVASALLRGEIRSCGCGSNYRGRVA